MKYADIEKEETGMNTKKGRMTLRRKRIRKRTKERELNKEDK